MKAPPLIHTSTIVSIKTMTTISILILLLHAVQITAYTEAQLGNFNADWTDIRCTSGKNSGTYSKLHCDPGRFCKTSNKAKHVDTESNMAICQPHVANSNTKKKCCVNCPTGYYMDKQYKYGNAQCQACAANQGVYQDELGQTSCKLCGAGFVPRDVHLQAKSTVDGACERCTHGRYQYVIDDVAPVANPFCFCYIYFYSWNAILTYPPSFLLLLTSYFFLLSLLFF